MDIRNLGNFANIAAVWASYPNGGIEGDYLFIPNEQGVKYRWNKYIQKWENAAVVTETTGRQHLDVTDINVRNELHVASHADVHGDLRVGGFLRAARVKQPNVGLFATVEALEAAYPSPEVGMWATVGDSVPGDVYRCETAGTWTATGETGGVDELENVVLYSAQELTDAQKKQARANLGFGDGDIDDVPTVGSENVVTSGGVKDAVDDLQEKLSTEKSARIAADNAESAARQSAISQQNAEIASFEEAVRTQISDYRPIVIEGDAVNAPDEEDLTSVTVGGTDVLKLKNRNSLYGMGYIILRRGSSFASQLTQANTIYEIRYDYSLGIARSETLSFTNSTTVVTDEYTAAAEDLEDATKDYNSAYTDLTSKQAILTQKEEDLAALIAGGATEEEIAEAEKAVDEAQDAVDEAQEMVDAAEVAKDAAQEVLDNTQHYYNYATVNLLAGECLTLADSAIGLNDERTAKIYDKGSVIYADENTTVTIGNISDTGTYAVEPFVRIPSDSVLKFEGGSISDGVLHSDKPVEIVSTKKCFSNITFAGLCKQSLIADLRWFVDAYPVNTSDTTVDNTQEVIQCMNCGTRSVLFPTDKFIRLTETVVVNQQINILTDNKDRQMFANFSSNISRNLEIPCVFSEQVVTLFEYHIGAFDGYGTKYNEPFIIGNINLVTTKPYSTISLDPESPDYRGTPVLYIDNKYAKGQVWGIKLNCSIASKTCSVPYDLATDTRKKTGYNWTGIDIRTVPDVYTGTCHAFAFLEINGDLYNLAVGFVTAEGDDGTSGWFNDVIIRGHLECSFGCESKCGGPLVVYGTHQSRRMHSSLLTQKGFFKATYIYLFGWVWDCDDSIDSTTKWVRANSKIEATSRTANATFSPDYNVLANNDYRHPNPVIIGKPITGNVDLRKFPNLLYYGLGSNVSNLLTNLDYSIQFVGEEDFVPSLHTGRIINEHCLFNDAMASPYTSSGGYPLLSATKLDLAYTTTNIYKVKVSFDLIIYSRGGYPTFLLVGNQHSKDAPSIKQAKISIKTKAKSYNEWTVLYSEENPLVLGSYHANRIDRCWRINLPKLGVLDYSHITIEVDYSDAPSYILPYISIPWFYGDVPKYRDCITEKLPVVHSYNRGWNTFNRTINKPVWWNGTTWITAEGYTMAAKSIGTTAERPVGVHQETIDGETVTVGTLIQSDKGFEYFDTDLKKPIYALSINTTTTGEVLWADADGQPLKWTNKEKIVLKKKKKIKDDILRFRSSGHSSETVEEFIDRIEITTVSEDALLTSHNAYDAKIIEASAGDAIQIRGVATSHVLLYYVISKEPHTGTDNQSNEYTYYKLTACGLIGTNLTPAVPYETLVEIDEDSWIILEAYNENATRTVGGEDVPYPYSNDAATPYEFIRYTNDAPAEIPTYGIMDNAPTALLGSSNTGFVYFATDLGTSGKPVFWNGSEWVDASGTVV